jgi:hypothetical protein
MTGGMYAPSDPRHIRVFLLPFRLLSPLIRDETVESFTLEQFWSTLLLNETGLREHLRSGEDALP